MATIASDKAIVQTSETMVGPSMTGAIQIGGATVDTVGLFGVTPTLLPAGADQGVITDSSGGTKGITTAVVAAGMRHVISIPIQLLGLVNSGVWKVAVPFAATIISAGFRTGKVVSTGSKAATLTVTTNGGGAVTGGVMALTSANQAATGTLLAASAISGAGATVTAGQTIEVTVSSVTAFAEGDGWVEFVVSNNDMANTIATLIAQLTAFRLAGVTLGTMKGAA